MATQPIVFICKPAWQAPPPRLLGNRAYFCVTSEQVLLDSGWKACSPGMVSRIL